MATERSGYTAGGAVGGTGGVIVVIAVATVSKGSDIAHDGLFWVSVALAGIGFLIVTITGGKHLLEIISGSLEGTSDVKVKRGRYKPREETVLVDEPGWYSVNDPLTPVNPPVKIPKEDRFVTIQGLHSSLTVPGGATVDISPLEMAVDWTKITKVEPLTIVKAQYGVADRWRDVTEIVRGRISNYKLNVLVGNEPFDRMNEIAPKTGKYLIIDYRINSAAPVRDEWQEGQRAILPKEDSRRRARNLSEVSKNPDFADDPISGGSEIPVDWDALQRMPIPDFSSEFKRFEQIALYFQPTEEWENLCHGWIHDVRVKLENWNQRWADRFDAWSPNDAVIHLGRPDIDADPTVANLYKYQERLKRILDQFK